MIHADLGSSRRGVAAICFGKCLLLLFLLARRLRMAQVLCRKRSPKVDWKVMDRGIADDLFFKYQGNRGSVRPKTGG
jgi:hypothetical protein